MKKVLLSLCFCLFLVPVAFAIDREPLLPFTPVQASVISPIALPPFVDNVYGARGNLIYGYNKRVVGFDVGLIQHSERTTAIQMGLLANISGTMEGIAAPYFFSYFPCVNIARDFSGLQFSYLYNSSDNFWGFQGIPLACNIANDVSGVQIAVLWNRARDVCFWQSAALANNARNLSGYQGGIANTVEDEMIGWQHAVAINNAGKMGGLQTSYILNRATESLHGIQFGAINYAKDVDGGLQIGLININKNRILPIINF